MQPLRNVFVLVGLIVAACTPAPPPVSPTGSSAQPVERRAANQNLRVSDTGMPASMSPESSISHLTFGLLYDNLTQLDNKFNVVPWGAEKWSQVDPTTWRVQLRRDLTFSNGDKVTAADVKFSVDWFFSAKTPQSVQLASVASTRVVDDSTVEFVTKAPDAALPTNLTYAWILPKVYFERVGRDGFVAKPIGSGPYELAEFRSGDFARFTLRSTPHGFRKASAPEITVRVLTEATAVVAGMQTGNLDIVVGLNLNADQLQALSRADAVYQSKPAGTLTALFPEAESKARNLPSLDKRVRQAINYAVNKEALSKTFYQGTALVAGQMAIPDTPFFDPAIQPYPYDPKKAKELLAAAGYPNGFKFPVGLDFTPFSANPNMMLAIQSDLRDVGIEMAVNSYELGAFLDKFYTRNGQTKGDLMVAVATEGNGLSTVTRSFYTCDKPAEAIWWCNSDFDRALSQMIAEPDPAKRPAFGRLAAQALTNDVSNLWLLHVPRYIVYAKNIKGFDFPATNVDFAYRVE